MAAKRPSKQPVREFFGKYFDSLVEGEERERGKPKPTPVVNLLRPFDSAAEPFYLSFEAAQEWWPVRLLRKAASEKDAEGYKRLLAYFLSNLNARPPKGVLLPYLLGVGRPTETEFIYELWVAKGRPPLTECWTPWQRPSFQSSLRRHFPMRSGARTSVIAWETRSAGTKTKRPLRNPHRFRSAMKSSTIS